MDEGSETSLCTFELAKRLNAHLTDCKIDICTNNAVTPVNKKIKSICIQRVGESTIFEVSDALLQKDIIDVSSSIPSNQITQDYRHLADLKFPAIDSSKVEVLLGQNVQSSLCVFELMYGSRNEAHALHTSLG